jgi:hypothetical protein
MKQFLAAVFFFAASVAPASEEPNVILILADDLAIGDLSSQNGGRSRTPHLDRLAEGSVRFSQAYSASCVCAPARAALLTGRYPHRTGVVTLNMNRYPELTRPRRDETTIADVLKASGYVTGLVGKWHCGHGTDYHPLRRGFDEFEGFSGSQELSYFRYTLDVAGEHVEVRGDYLTNDLSRRAIEFVRRHRNRPFFLHLAHYAPHRPLEAPAELIESYREKGLDEHPAPGGQFASNTWSRSSCMTISRISTSSKSSCLGLKWVAASIPAAEMVRIDDPSAVCFFRPKNDILHTTVPYRFYFGFANPDSRSTVDARARSRTDLPPL